MHNQKKWIRKSSKYLFESEWYNLRQDEITLPNGEDSIYTLIEHPGYSMVVPLLSNNQIIMIRIYRYSIDKTLLECPSGGLDGDTPIEGARRELLEETGYEAHTFESLGSFYGSNGISNEHFHLFLASNLVETGCTHHEPTEQISLEIFPFDEVVKMALSGKIEDAPSSLAIMLAHQKLKEGPTKESTRAHS